MQVNTHVHIIAACKNHRTYLKHNYYKQPFRLADITEEKTGELLRLMMMSSSPGILDNDHYCIKIDVQEGAKVHLTTQGYQRLFTMRGSASQQLNVYISDKGDFYFLPHPVAPHAASNFSSVNNIYLHRNHNLVWSEIITCGRKLHGEEFKFTRYHNITGVYLDGKLVVKENILLEPLKKDVYALGQMEGYSHQSTLLFINNRADIKKISEECNELLSSMQNIVFGISALPVNGLTIKMLGQKGEVLFNCNNKLASAIQNVLCGHIKTDPEIMPSGYNY